MKTITLAAPKGGSGKTTATLLLAVHAHHQKYQVAIFDMNADQGNIEQWRVSRGGTPGPVIVEVEKLNRDAQVLAREGYDILYIDSPPGIDNTAIVEACVAISDAVIIPARPSILDIGTMDTIVEICREHRKPLAFLLCDVTPQWKGLNNSAVAALAELGPVLCARITHKLGYVNALTEGKTGPEIDSNLEAEVAAVWTDVQRLVGITPKKGRRNV